MKRKPLTWAEQLRHLRAALGLTQEQAAGRIADLSVRTWQTWEAGRQEPPLWSQRLILPAITASHAALLDQFEGARASADRERRRIASLKPLAEMLRVLDEVDDSALRPKAVLDSPHGYMTVEGRRYENGHPLIIRRGHAVGLMGEAARHTLPEHWVLYTKRPKPKPKK